MKDLLNFAKIFSTQPLATGNRIAIVTNGGGTGVITTDALYKSGLKLATLSKDSETSLRKVMPSIVNIRLPLDLAGDADDKRFGDALNAVENDDNVDAIVTIALFQTPGADSKLAESLIHFGTQMKKPMVVISMGGSFTQAHKAIMESAGLPVYGSPSEAASSLVALIDYSKYRGKIL